MALSRLLVITRASESVWEEEFMFTCRWVPLQGACVRDRCDPVAADAMPVCPGRWWGGEEGVIGSKALHRAPKSAQ